MNPSATTSAVSGIGTLIYLAILVLEFAAMWIIFAKAGRPGWAAIIPLYNTYTLIKLTGHSGWWLALLFVPIVNLVIYIMLMLDLARVFGRGTGFAIGLIFLAAIFVPILAFGDSRYVGAATQPGPRPGLA